METVQRDTEQKEASARLNKSISLRFLRDHGLLIRDYFILSVLRTCIRRERETDARRYSRPLLFIRRIIRDLCSLRVFEPRITGSANYFQLALSCTPARNFLTPFSARLAPLRGEGRLADNCPVPSNRL